MNKVIISLLIIFGFTSCTMKEKMVLNEDGSGTFSYGFDMSAFMKMGKSTDSNSTKTPKVIDSVFTLKDLMAPLKDSIIKLSDAEKEQFKLLEMFRVKMKLNEELKEFSYEMELDFTSTDSLKNMVSPTKAAVLLSISDKKVGKKLLKQGVDDNKSKASFSYDGKYFIKKVTSSNAKKRKDKSKVKRNSKFADFDDEFSKKIEEIFKECKYSIEYYFPKKIKSVSLKGATVSEDRKSFVLDIPIENLKDDSDLSFKVEFE